MKPASNPPSRQRLLSLDVFRGFTVAAMILVNTPGSWSHIYAPLKHAQWNGCTPTDIIFPGFLFMVGIAVVYALQQKRQDALQHKPILLHALRRSLTLIALGLFITLLYHPELATLRFPGVLQRIGLVYMVIVLIYLKLPERSVPWIFVSLLLMYYLLLVFTPVPGADPRLLDPNNNIVAVTDRFLFGTQHLSRYTKTRDALGLLSTLPAIATALFGVQTGLWLKDRTTTASTKTVRLLLAGTAAIVAGLLWGLSFPINKSLWTSSYVLYSGGICSVGLGITYWLLDVKGLQKRCWPFLVFGTNAIAAYILSEALPRFLNLLTFTVGDREVGATKVLYQFLLQQSVSPENASLISALSFVVFIWLLMLPLYKRNIIIKL